MHILQFLTQVDATDLMTEVMEFVVCGGNSNGNESTLPLPLSARSAKEIVIESYRHLVTAANGLQPCEVSM